MTRPRDDIAPAGLLSASLVAWYARSARTLPWRSDPTPYHVLVSELMLQQTRVDTVIERFARFVRRWPDLEALAGASEEEVLHEWAGLGYYARARNLHAAARAAHAAGGLPSDPDALRRLPGIGPYTAGAVASIAYGVATPLVDGNVERVLSRVDGRDDDPRAPAGKRALWARATDMVAHEDPRTLNQALMELGALVCTPRSPGCGRCPWASWCVARRDGTAESLPRKAAKPPPKPIRGAAGILRRDGAVLVGRRPAKGLLAGLWEPVGADLSDAESSDAGLRRGLRERIGVDARVGPLLGSVLHVFSHRRLVLEVFEVSTTGEPRAAAFYDDLRWTDPRRADHLGLSTLARKTLDLASPAQVTLLAAEPAPE